MRRKLRCWKNHFVCNNLVTRTIIQYTNHRTVLHRPARQIAHPPVCSFTIKITPFQKRQCHLQPIHRANPRQPADIIIYPIGDIDSDISAVPFRPTFLPKISGYFGNFSYFLCKSFPICQNRFHLSTLHIKQIRENQRENQNEQAENKHNNSSSRHSFPLLQQNSPDITEYNI